MAASSIFKNAIFSLSKSSSSVGPSIPLRPKVSRVCFTSATNFPQGRSAAEDDGRRNEYTPFNADGSAAEPQDEVGETMEKAKQKTREMKDKAKDNAADMKDKTTDKAKEAKDEAEGKAREMNEYGKEKLGFVADKAGEMTEKTKEGAHDAKEKAKEAADKTKGVAEKVAEKAKETVQGAWGAAKETTQKIKETVVGKADEVDDYVEDHVKKPGEKVMDEEVKEKRNRENGPKKKY